VLSYLGVALGAMLLLIIVVTLVVQNYFYTAQLNQFRANAEYSAQEIGQYYQSAGGDWEFIPRITLTGPEFYIVVDANDQLLGMSRPAFNASAFQQALQQALQGHEVQGNEQFSSDSNNSLGGFYVSVPIRNGGQPDGAIIGALVVAEPLQYPAGFSPTEFLANVDKAILITGSVIALAVIIFSLWLARQLTKPLASLTFAAEQMGVGDYAQRVVIPKGNDELGKLALSFNSMAERIELDVTELHQQDQMRRDLVANIAHDLATPLTAIQGFSEALADDVITDPQARQETAQLIGREVQRLRRLVSDMQQMTSFESGRLQLDQEPLNLHALVDEVLEVIQPECEQVGITLRNEIDATTPDVLADSDRMTQVLLNLLDNARRYTPNGGSIIIGARLNANNRPNKQQQLTEGHAAYVQAGQKQLESLQAKQNQAPPFIESNVGAASTKRSGKLMVDSTSSHSGQLEGPREDNKWLLVWVQDTGTGINPQDLPYIFDRFFRSDRSRTATSGGSGLGLAIIKAIITAHGGSVSAESTPGKGTCIAFTVPLA
jgi:signal transduction histidine kinase